MNFTQAQLENCTLGELERFHGLYPDDLTVCHAYIRTLDNALRGNLHRPDVFEELDLDETR